MFALKKWLGHLLMPLPFSLSLLLIALFLLLFTRFQKTAKAIVACATLLIALLGSYPVSYQLARPLEAQFPPFEINKHTQLDAIVVLGNGHVSDPLLPTRQWQNSVSLARTLEGIRLANAYPQAKLIFSGFVEGDPLSNAKVNSLLAQEYGIAPDRISLFENNKDTHDEAVNISQFWHGKQVALVSSASHLPRAMALYQQAGLSAIAAPTDYTAKQSQLALPLYSYLPRGRFMMYSEVAMHEWIGLLWARLRGQLNE